MTRKNYDAKKASAENTALWIMADVHRAQAEGAKTVTVKIEDLSEVMSYVASIKVREQIEFAGKPLGFCRPSDLHDLLNRKCRRMFIVAKKDRQFNTQVSFTEVGQVMLPHSASVAPPAEKVEDSPC